MTDTLTLRTDAELIDSIIERGFDPALSVHREEFIRLLNDAESLDAAGVSALPPTIAVMGQQFGETGEALTLPVAIGQRWLYAVLRTTPVSFSDEAAADALGTLIRRLVPTLQQTVQFEAIVSRSARNVAGRPETLEADGEPQPLLQRWLDRWKMFPVLASLVTLILVNWIQAVEDMIRALEQDHANVAATLTSSTTPLSIRAIHGDAGDPHLGGRSVMILTFADDSRVVFKPKQLAVTDVFRELVDRINEAGFTPGLRVHDALVRDTHTWEQFIPHRSCSTSEDIETFYRRMGGWIRLLQILEGRDFWLDNLIADGEHPIFIDLETIVQPRRSDAALSGVAAVVQEHIDSSPLATNIVAMLMPIGPTVGSEDLGCFAAPKDFLSPFPATEIPGISAEGPNRGGFRTWTHPEHAPMLHGEPVLAEPWFPAIESGYREMAKTIDRLAPELLQPGGLIDRLCSHTVRTIFRDTWTCMTISQRSIAPPLLGNYRRRRQFLERMEGDTTGNGAITGPVIAAEVRALAALDVPFFTATGSDDAICPPDAEPIPGFFDGTVRDRIDAHLRSFSPQQLDDDISLLRTSFWTTHPETPVAAPTINRSAKGEIGSEAWQDAANQVAEDIAATRIEADDGTSGWMAISYLPTVDVDTWSPIGNDLLTGRAGLAAFFCDQWLATGDDRWRELALESLAEVAGAVRYITPAWESGPALETTLRTNTPVLGAFNGIGGMLAALRYAGGTFDDRNALETWRSALDRIDWPEVLRYSSADPVIGSTGLALSLAAVPSWQGELPDDLVALLTSREAGDHPVRFDRTSGLRQRLSVLPDTTVGRLLVLHRYEGGGASDVADAVSTMLAAPELSPGDMLGLVSITQPGSPIWHKLASLAEGRIRRVRLEGRVSDQLDAVELAFELYRISRVSFWLETTAAFASDWIAEWNRTGSWFPDSLADDRYLLSPIWGPPAIASVFHRLAGAPVIASLRTMQWQQWAL